MQEHYAFDEDTEIIKRFAKVIKPAIARAIGWAGDAIEEEELTGLDKDAIEKAMNDVKGLVDKRFPNEKEKLKTLLDPKTPISKINGNMLFPVVNLHKNIQPRLQELVEAIDYDIAQRKAAASRG